MWHGKEHGSRGEAGNPCCESLALGLGKERLDPGEVGGGGIEEEVIWPDRKLGS